MTRKLLAVSAVIFFLLIFFPKTVFAADLNIECSSSVNCTLAGSNPLFDQSLDGSWYPGKSITKAINLKNTSTDTKQIKIKAVGARSLNKLDEVMLISILDNSGIVTWSGLLQDFLEQDGLVVGTLKSGIGRDIYFKVEMSKDAENNYQGLETTFSLTLGFWGDEIDVNPPVKQVLGAKTTNTTSLNKLTDTNLLNMALIFTLFCLGFFAFSGFIFSIYKSRKKSNSKQ